MQRARHDRQENVAVERRAQEGRLLGLLFGLALGTGRWGVCGRDVLTFLLFVMGLVVGHVLGHVTLGGDRLFALAH